MKRIAIVGAGPGGLFSAFLLKQKCAQSVDVTLFEAGPRLGGKIITKQFSTAPISYESGAAELYQYGRDPLRVLVKNVLGLPVTRMSNGTTVVMNNMILRTLRDVRAHYGKRTTKAIKRFKQLGRRMRPYDDFYNSGWPSDNKHPYSHRTFQSLLNEIPDADARNYFHTLLHSDLAIDPSLTTALFGIENLLINEKGYCRLYTIEGGLSRLVAALSGAITAQSRLNTIVEHIGKTADHKYRVRSRQDQGMQNDEYDAIMLALPLCSLPGLSWGSAKMREAMDAHCNYYYSPAHYLRVSVLFDSPFWHHQIKESVFHLDTLGGCCVYDEGLRSGSTEPYGSLSWLMAGNAALALGALPDDVIINKTIDSLPKSFGSARPHFIEGHVDRWIGAVNGHEGRHKLRGSRVRHIPEPKTHPGIILVGDYLFDSTINGALESADIATDVVLKHLHVPSRCLACDYFDSYSGRAGRYKESFEDLFDGRSVTDLIAAVWHQKPPYRLLDAGSASGLTLREFEKLGVEAWGVESNWYIHGQTPEKWKLRNLLGDVCALPFPDGHFDFVYETCLCYLAPELLPQAVQELSRVAKRGVILGSIVADMRKQVLKEEDLLFAIDTTAPLKKWAKLFESNGFRRAITKKDTARAAYKIDSSANHGKSWYKSARDFALCFYTPVSQSVSQNRRQSKPSAAIAPQPFKQSYEVSTAVDA